MACNKQPKPVHQLTAAQFDKLFKTEDDCIRYLVARRWPNGVRCPRCGSERVYPVSTMDSTGSATLARMRAIASLT